MRYRVRLVVEVGSRRVRYFLRISDKATLEQLALALLFLEKLREGLSEGVRLKVEELEKLGVRS